MILHSIITSRQWCQWNSSLMGKLQRKWKCQFRSMDPAKFFHPTEIADRVLIDKTTHLFKDFLSIMTHSVTGMWSVLSKSVKFLSRLIHSETFHFWRCKGMQVVAQVTRKETDQRPAKANWPALKCWHKNTAHCTGYVHWQIVVPRLSTCTSVAIVLSACWSLIRGRLIPLIRQWLCEPTVVE